MDSQTAEIKNKTTAPTTSIPIEDKSKMKQILIYAIPFGLVGGIASYYFIHKNKVVYGIIGIIVFGGIGALIGAKFSDMSRNKMAQ